MSSASCFLKIVFAVFQKRTFSFVRIFDHNELWIVLKLTSDETAGDSGKDKVVISHSRNSSDSSGYHEASVLSDNPDSAGRLPETLPRRNRVPAETSRKLAQTSQSSKSLGNLTAVSATLTRGVSNTSLSSAGLRKKRAAPPPPVTRPLSSAISTQALERIVDSEESLTSDMDPSKPPSDIGVPFKSSSDIEECPKASSDIGVTTKTTKLPSTITEPSTPNMKQKSSKLDVEPHLRLESLNVKSPFIAPGGTVPVKDAPVDARTQKRVGVPIPHPKPRQTTNVAYMRPQVPQRKVGPSSLSRTLHADSSKVASSSTSDTNTDIVDEEYPSADSINSRTPTMLDKKIKDSEKVEVASNYSSSDDDVFLTPETDHNQLFFRQDSIAMKGNNETQSPNTLELVEDDGTAAKEESSAEKSEEEIERQSNKSTLIEQNSITSKKSLGQERKLSAVVISTIPKCDHLIIDKQPILKTWKGKKRQESDALEIEAEVDGIGDKVGKGMKDSKRARIPRMASKSNDFETNTLEKQKRYLTSHLDDIAFALNFNVASNSLLSDQSKESKSDVQSSEQKKIGSQGEADASLSDTDVLLQKVSDTLSNTLPVSTLDEVSVEGFVSPAEVKPKTTNISKEADFSIAKESTKKQDVQQNNSLLEKSMVNTSAGYLAINSQQDTSDYVSAADEDLSISDWEYQLPAPPSAFRDAASPVHDNVDAVPSSIESFTDTKINKEETEVGENLTQKTPERNKVDSRHSLEEQATTSGAENLLENKTKEEMPQRKSVNKQKSDINLKKEVILELENKIGTLPQGTKDSDFKRISDSSTPKIAPIDNTLSNFTITTYSRQKSLNIFEEADDKSPQSSSNDRYVKSFATWSRNRSNFDETEDKNLKDFTGGTLQGKKRANEGDTIEKKLEPKIQTESHRWNCNEKDNIQRSNSCVSVCDKSRFQGKFPKDEDSRCGGNLAEVDGVRIENAISSTNLSTPTVKSIEKFSQWRDNILKKQEEPTKEKQLQSLQVMKSILPRLKNAQQVEENVPKESDDTVLSKKTRSEITSHEHSIDSNTPLTHDSQRAQSNKTSEADSKKLAAETNAKRYTYFGPPTINLGSWSERPSVNVQIKKDADYKLGSSKASNKTIVNINCTRDDIDNLNFTEDSKLPGKVEDSSLDRKDPNDLTRKLITHTMASGFKKPLTNKVNLKQETVSNDKPVVTGVELKKSYVEDKQDDNEIDMSPVNFKKLSKACGQDVSLRSKSKKSTVSRRSDPQLESYANKHNGHVTSEKFSVTNDECLTNQDSSKSKRFTLIVGIHPQNQRNFAYRNGVGVKSSQAMPIVKGFKVSNSTMDDQENQKECTKAMSTESNGVHQPPSPPTMPVIMGVTLKNSRPKFMPVQVNPRDVLLESIRSFGGRENLKNATERC
ncbi:uncharacterized protein LOC128882712 [Hylaeus volcanicus]|uniref:uncharacterized protein LOC128882712 n=1 Tax=Hylaeus volcanicus TaxID=313075 RepID=UPI0023B81201|nr:uncharacterized protein LOC128882712 [Hylaeus volcanicus]